MHLADSCIIWIIIFLSKMKRQCCNDIRIHQLNVSTCNLKLKIRAYKGPSRGSKNFLLSIIIWKTQKFRKKNSLIKVEEYTELSLIQARTEARF